MASCLTWSGSEGLCRSASVVLVFAVAACSSSSGGAGASAGSGPVGGAGGAVATAGSSGSISAAGSGLGGASVAGSGAGGSTAGSAGAAGAAGAGTGGAPNGGSGGSGTAGAGTAGSSGAAGASGGSANCAGNAISLSANGTGMASDAAQARVSIDMMTDLPIGNAHRTVEFWAYIQTSDWIGEKNEVYVYGSPKTATVMNTAFGLDFGTNTVTGMATNHATFNPYTNGSLTIDSSADLGITSAAAQWVHVAMSWDGASFKTYVNGEPKITMTDGTTMLATTSTPLTMGCNPPIFNCFNGMFDELRVWNVNRSDADIKANYNKPSLGTEPGLVGYWRFNEAPGSASAADSVASAGHTAHAGQLLATADNQKPTFVTPKSAVPLVCP
ncbi:MAG TPA: LamG domain-containing protein [Polyangiaceae bacterium]